ncbi:SMI1/KNR4 family protein [Lentzea sp. NPDC006480]|uniref:SMI1/KNR4 family protein n=1 Tax=Lentzea sp. NPDC006480 TaxID=3157176 RepID=UPI0033B7FD90
MTDASVGDVPRTPDDWREYLVEYGREYVRTANVCQREFMKPEHTSTCWFGPGPADERTIAATEQRLGTRLPPTLRSFLAVSDGWSGMVAFFVDEILPCAGIGWLRDSGWGAELIEIYGEEGEGDDELRELLEMFRRALLIADGEDIWLLDPGRTGEDGEWAGFHLAPGEGGYPDEYTSFADLLHSRRLEHPKIIEAEG